MKVLNIIDARCNHEVYRGPCLELNNKLFTTVTLGSLEYALPDDGDFTETCKSCFNVNFNTRVGTLIVATIYLQLIQNRYMFRSFTVLQCSHQHCVQPVASDVEVVGYL